MTQPGEIANEDESQGQPVPPVPTRARGNEDEDGYESLRGRLRRAFRVLRGRDVGERVLTDPEKGLRQARARQENRWRDVYAFFLLLAMLGQVAFADLFLWRFADANQWVVDPTIVIAFFGSVVVEVIGLVLVITQSLFPRSKRDSESDGS